MTEEFKCPPVMICGFNRPDCLKQVFARVREAKPAQLFLVLDAPREDRSDDVAKVAECKKIFDSVDWPCEVVQDYAEKNLGCRRRMASGITNAFKHIEQCIILEDDCVPHPDFFKFCSEMLERYADDTRIGMVAGFREHPLLRKRKESYYYSRFTQIWGWATWRRAWAKYGTVPKPWDLERIKVSLEPIFRKKPLIDRVAGWFDDAYYGRSNSWATVWWMSNVFENFLTIHPAVNMVTNIGATGCHNRRFNREVHNVQAEGMNWPLVHPDVVMPDAIDEAAVRRQMTPRATIKGVCHLMAKKLKVCK